MTSYPAGTHMAELQQLLSGSVLPSPNQTYWVTIGNPAPWDWPTPQGEFVVYRGVSPDTSSPIYTHAAPATNSDGYFIQLQNGQLLFFGGDPSEGVYDFEWSTTAVPDDAKDYWYVTDNGVIEVVNPVSGAVYNPLGISGDPVTGFDLTGITYDLSQASITSVTPLTLYTETLTNATAVQQTSEVDQTFTTTSTYSFSGTLGIKVGVKVSGGVNIPLVTSGKVEVDTEVDVSFTVGVTQSYQEQWALKQPVVVPAHSSVTVTVMISSGKFTVPYTVTGNYVYASGNTASATGTGTFTGVNGYDAQVMLQTGGPTGSVTLLAGPAAGTITKV